MRRPVLLAVASLACVLAPAASAAANPIAVENAKPGTREWATVPLAPTGAIEGYASEVSVVPGETIHFHVSTMPPARYQVRIYRLGAYRGAGGRLLTCLPSCIGDEPGQAQEHPAPDRWTGLVEAGWPVTDQLTIPAGWPSGYYLAQLRLTGGPAAGTADHIPFVVREGADRHSDILVQVPVNTWQAYNFWGGASLYPFVGRQGTYVSFDRPYAHGQGTQEVSDWELALVHFLEAGGYDVSYQTDVDTHRDEGSLDEHRLVMTAGHGEYWTKEIRDAFDAARDAGTNLAFMGANTGYWQVRYENGERRIVSYKTPGTDPNPDPAVEATQFRELVPPRYECELEGIQHLGGSHLYRVDDYGVNAAALPDPWFRGTGFRPGSVLRGIISVERDDIPQNQTAASSCGHALTVFFHHPDTGHLDDASAVRYTAPSGARVFASGTHMFAFGLDPAWHPDVADARLVRFMDNAMDDLTRPAAPVAIQARARRRRVSIRVSRRPDGRVRDVLVFRLPARGLVSPELPGGAVPVCTSPTGSCLDAPPPGWYRYAAETVDPWRRSYPLVSAVVRVGRR